MKVVLGMPFLSFSNANVEFTELGKLTQKSYDTVEVLPITSWVKLIDKQKFAKIALDKNSGTVVVYVATLKIPTAILIYLPRTSQVLRLINLTMAVLK